MGAAPSPRWGGRAPVASIIAPRAALPQASRRRRVGRLVPVEDAAALTEAMRLYRTPFDAAQRAHCGRDDRPSTRAKENRSGQLCAGAFLQAGAKRPKRGRH